MKRHNFHITFLFLFTVLPGFPSASTIQAQQSNTFYLMHEVPQSNLLNPAVQLQCKYYIGFPVLAAAHINYSNTAFTYQDLAGGDAWDIDGILDQMHRTDLYSVEAALNLISLGYRHKSYYFTFHIEENFRGYQTVPKDLARMLVEGNGPFIGETARFGRLRPGGYHSREYALGVSKVLGPYLTAGIRARLQFGKANVYTGGSEIQVSTREDNFGLHLEGDYTLNTSFPYSFTHDGNGNISGIDMGDLEPVSYLLNRGNPGFSLDLGAIFRYNERITLSASALDLGFIRWKTDLNNVRGMGEFMYTGVDSVAELVSTAFLSDITDSILNAMDVTESQLPYTYAMPAQIFLGGSYRYSERISFGLVNRNLIYRSKIHSSFTLSATADLAERFLATLSWSYLNNSLKNVGIGMAYHGKGLQFHVVTDNLLGFFNPFNTRTLNLRFGVNLMFGCPRNKREREQEEALGRLPLGGDCPYPEKPAKKKKKKEKAVRRINRI